MQSLPEALVQAEAYPHPVASVHLIETHLSWVFLTGEYVYKVKKPVHFDFVDFSTLSRRRHFCFEEVRCNRAFAPELYLGVAALVAGPDGSLKVALEAPEDASGIVEYAVRMRQFDGALQADRLLEAGELSVYDMRQFGARLATQHARLPELDAPYSPGEAILDNFTTLRASSLGADLSPQLQPLEAYAREQLQAFDGLLMARHAGHCVRECHGDLHLSNLARLESGMTAFDCLEFDEGLRNIDFWCDSGFLFMDCCVRERRDLAYAFVDGYLDVSGDYEGVQLLPMFADYRSVVRAKVAALRYEQSGAAEDRERVDLHLRWSRDWQSRPTGKLWVMCGLSGSGKSYWAEQLLPQLPALRLRSDVLRKTLHGLDPLQDSGSAVGAGLYKPQSSDRVYADLARYAVGLLELGEHVIVDAACLHKAQRQVLYEAAAAIGADVGLLFCTAPEALLRQRISKRQSARQDPSEADLAVLDWQLEHFARPTADEPVITIDTTDMTVQRLLALLA